MKPWSPSLATAGSLAILLFASPSTRAQGPTPALIAKPEQTGTAPANSPSPSPAAKPQPTGTTPAVAGLPQFHSADDLWAHIEALEQGPATPSPSPQDVMALMRQLSSSAAEFQTRFPTDPRRWQAKLIALQYNTMLASAENREPDPAQIEAELKAVAAAPDAPTAAKIEARINLIDLHAQASGEDTLAPAVEQEMLAFIHDFPDEPDDAALQKMRLESLQKTDPQKAATLLDSLLKDSNPAVVRMAQGQVAMRDLTKKPLELQFTAVDGSKVDVSQLRGKVVLVDFWATWCAPCMERVPDLVKVYKEFHPQGLEIVGISLDQDKSLVVAVTKSSGMVWPQYFDGKGWENAISSRYGISSIPRMWLVDRKGMVVDSDAEDAVEEKVGNLISGAAATPSN
jgi:thiol-disulfide isomerase/thioredoxin